MRIDADQWVSRADRRRPTVSFTGAAQGLLAALLTRPLGVANVAYGSIAAERSSPSADLCPLLVQ